MTEEQARSVISDPSPELVPADAVDQIVTGLSSTKSVFRAKDYDLFGREFDPALLSVVCQQLNNHRRQKGEKQITANVVIQGKDEILRTFYETGFEGLPKEARFFVEDQLLDESGFRIREALPTALNRPGITEETIGQLINRRLIRQEVSHGHEWLELSHDVLAGVAKESRAWRRNQELLRKARRRLIASVIIASGVSILAIVMAFVAFKYYQNVQDLKRANDRFLLEEAGQFLTNAANKHETAAVYKLLRQFSALNINVPQTEALLTFLPPQRWKPSQLINIPAGEPVRNIIFSPDGQYLAALTKDGNLFISDKCKPNQVADKSDPDFRQVSVIGTTPAKNRCRAIAFNPVNNDHRLTVRTSDNQFITLDCTTLFQGQTQSPRESDHLDATVPKDSLDVADHSIEYFYDRLFILWDDGTLRIRDKDNHEITVALPKDLSGTGSDRKPHQVRLFEAGESCEPRPTFYLWRDETLSVVSLDKDFRSPNLLASSEGTERVDQFAVGVTGVAAEYNQVDSSLEVISYLPARQIFRVRLKDLDESIQEPNAIAIGSNDILVCSADGTIQNFLLNPGGTFSTFATLRTPTPVAVLSFRPDQLAFATGSSTGQVLIWSRCVPPVGQSTVALVPYSPKQTDQLTGKTSRWNISPSGKLLVVEGNDGIFCYELRKETGPPVLAQKKQARRRDELYFDIRIDDGGRVTSLTSTENRDELRVTGDSTNNVIDEPKIDSSVWPVLSPDGALVGYISRDKNPGNRQLVVRHSSSGTIKCSFPLREMGPAESASSTRSAIIAFDPQSRRVAIFDSQLERLAIFDLENPANDPDSIAVPLPFHLNQLHFTRDGSGLILSFDDSTLALVDIPSPLLLGPFGVPSYSVVGDSPRGTIVYDKDGKSTGNPGFAELSRGETNQVEPKLALACVGSKITKKNGLYEVLESLDDFKAQIRGETVSNFSVSEAQKWEHFRNAARSLAALGRSSSAEEAFQILDQLSPLLRAEEFPSEYEPRILQIAWRVSRNLHENNLAALPSAEFENLPPKLRIIFDNTITTLSPHDRSAKVKRACDLADLFYSGEKYDSPSADDCLTALKEAVGDTSSGDLEPADQDRIRTHFHQDLRSRSDFPPDLLIQKSQNHNTEVINDKHNDSSLNTPEKSPLKPEPENSQK